MANILVDNIEKILKNKHENESDKIHAYQKILLQTLIQTKNTDTLNEKLKS